MGYHAIDRLEAIHEEEPNLNYAQDSRDALRMLSLYKKIHDQEDRITGLLDKVDEKSKEIAILTENELCAQTQLRKLELKYITVKKEYEDLQEEAAIFVELIEKQDIEIDKVEKKEEK